MSDYFNSFANPQGGGGQDLPQPGTPEWAAWLRSIGGQGPMAGQIPGQPMAGAAAPAAGASPGPAGPLSAGGLSPQLQAAINDPRLMNYQASLVPIQNSSDYNLPGSDPTPLPGATPPTPVGTTVPPPAPTQVQVSSARPVNFRGKLPGAHAAPTPPTAYARPGGEYQVGDPRNPNPPPSVKRAAPAAAAATDDSMLYPFKAIGGAAAAPSGAGLPDAAVAAQAAQRAAAASGAVTPPTGPLYPAADVSLYPHALIPGAPSSGATPNLGYYRPTPGNARVPMPMQYAANDPRMFRGPLASQPTAAPAAPPAPAAPAAAAPAAAPGAGPIAPGVGTQWLRKMFPGLQPTA